MAVSFVDDRYMYFINEGNVLLMDNWLDVFVNVLFNDNWLMMLMNHLLMMLMHNIFWMFNKHIFVMFMDHVLVNLFQNGLSNVGLDFCSKIVLLNDFSFIDFSWFRIALMLDDDCFFGNYLNNGGSYELFSSCVFFTKGLDKSTLSGFIFFL